MTLVCDSSLVQLVLKAYAAVQYVAVERTGLEPRHGVGARLRLLRWISAMLGQPGFS